MPRPNDYIGRHFGCLVVIECTGSRELYGEKHKFWRCICDTDRGGCGGEIECATLQLTSGRRWHCAACEPERRDYRKDYRRHLSKFTSAETALYHAIVRGRTSVQVKAEAVDWVMRLTPDALLRDLYDKTERREAELSTGSANC